ncbi:hypothetical protein LC612_19825 [Nostoc sp. CHAB 5834]|nr:hypothetical protein [Nostoc sp. CHAB 5834]
MATIKISELQPESQFEKLSDADLRSVNGGQAFQFVTTGSTLVTGVTIGPGSIRNSTSSQAGLSNSPVISAFVNVRGVSQSFPR